MNSISYSNCINYYHCLERKQSAFVHYIDEKFFALHLKFYGCTPISYSSRPVISLGCCLKTVRPITGAAYNKFDSFQNTAYRLYICKFNTCVKMIWHDLCIIARSMPVSFWDSHFETFNLRRLNLRKLLKGTK